MKIILHGGPRDGEKMDWPNNNLRDFLRFHHPDDWPPSAPISLKELETPPENRTIRLLTYRRYRFWKDPALWGPGIIQVDYEYLEGDS